MVFRKKRPKKRVVKKDVEEVGGKSKYSSEFDDVFEVDYSA